MLGTAQSKQLNSSMINGLAVLLPRLPFESKICSRWTYEEYPWIAGLKSSEEEQNQESLVQQSGFAYDFLSSSRKRKPDTLCYREMISLFQY